MKRNQKQNHTKNRLHSKVDERIPFIEHVHELRRRLFYIAVSVLGVSLVAYAVQQHLVNILLKPAKGQHFIYTSPGGGLDFLFRVCVYTGIAVSIPVIVYQVLRYLEPLLKDDATAHFITIGSIVSGVFAVAGVIFGYLIGLPAVLHFLFHQFTTQQIQPLVTIQSYISFVTVYMLGSALLLQVPLILLFINRIKPLKPSSLIRNERWLVLGAFVASGLMNPTPNIFSQLMVAGPIIIMYQIGIVIIWSINRHSRHSPKMRAMLEQDAAAREARLAAARESEPGVSQTELKPTAPALIKAPMPITSNSQQLVTAPTRPDIARAAVRQPVERRRYFADVRPPAYKQMPQAE